MRAEQKNPPPPPIPWCVEGYPAEWSVAVSFVLSTSLFFFFLVWFAARISWILCSKTVRETTRGIV